MTLLKLKSSWLRPTQSARLVRRVKRSVATKTVSDYKHLDEDGGCIEKSFVLNVYPCHREFKEHT